MSIFSKGNDYITERILRFKNVSVDIKHLKIGRYEREKLVATARFS